MAAEQCADAIVVKVTDNGVGMSPETLEKACLSGFTTKPDGNGLGLFITHRLCQVIKASMRMDSREGQGTTVTLALPGVGNDRQREGHGRTLTFAAVRSGQ